MDMKKILQAIDGQAAKPEAQVGDMKRFVSIIAEGAGKLNRLTAAESIAVNTYTEYDSKIVEKKTNYKLIDKYFKEVEAEVAESLEKKKEKSTKLAERVIERVVPGQQPAPGVNRLTGNPNVQTAPTSPTTQQSGGFSREYLQGVIDGKHPRPMISVEKAQQLLQQMDQAAVAEAGGNYGHPSNFKKHISQSKTPPENIIKMAKSGAKTGNHTRRYQREETDPVDTVTLDIPLLLRIMEYSKEDAQDDMALHDVTQRLIELSKKVDVINMDHYDAIVSGKVDESLRTDNPCWKGYKAVGTKKKNGKTVPNCVPK